MQQWEKVEKLKRANESYFNSWEWNWFCTLNLDDANQAKAEDLLKKWRRTEAKRCHMQFACMGVYNTLPQPHVHLVALGKNRFGDSLLMVDHEEWEAAWNRLTHLDAKIIPIWDDEAQEQIVSYIVKGNMPSGCSDLVWAYNGKLLKQSKIR